MNEPAQAGVSDPQGRNLKEVQAFSEDRGAWMRNWKIDETIAKLFRAALFLFILGINWWWDRNVLAILWQTGRDGSHFHLSDKVLIALVTTSVANFLALVLVIVKNLFPATPLGQAG